MLTSPPLSGVRRGRLCRGVGAETVIIRISRDLRQPLPRHQCNSPGSGCQVGSLSFTQHL